MFARVLFTNEGLLVFVFLYIVLLQCVYIQGGSDMTGTNCDLFTHK